ncbi:hypothetical protein [Streptomyces sp. NPDC050560]|uniref:hypothetical protein n=1 Tax=Streptomyces sp. NPDC050560 TaxID=3365630 RepID=UPI00379D067D
MTPRYRVGPGPSGTPADREAGRAARRLLAGELARARAAALAWRNGLAGLFVGLLSFGLVRGRTDVGGLASPYDALVGGALSLCLVLGTSGALLLLRAAHGAPAARRLPTGPPAGALAVRLGDHMETRRTARALARGVALTIACGAMLVAGVALTWYGPGDEGPRVLVRTPSGVLCATSVRTDGARLLLRTASGDVTVRLVDAEEVTAAAACPGGPDG